MTLQISDLTTDDLAGVSRLFDLYRQFYDQTPDPFRAQRFLSERLTRRESVVLVAATTGDGPIGFCQLYPGFCSIEAAPIYTLSDLFVLPETRRGGVGRALLEAAERRAMADGKVRMELTTARSNLKAQSLYASLGWVLDEVYLAYHRHLMPSTLPEQKAP